MCLPNDLPWIQACQLISVYLDYRPTCYLKLKNSNNYSTSFFTVIVAGVELSIVIRNLNTCYH